MNVAVIRLTEIPIFQIDTDATYKLLHGTTILGAVSNLYADQPEVGGDFAPYPEASGYRPFFEHCTDDERDFPEPNGDYPNEYFDDELWFVEHPAEGRMPIWLPAIHWIEGDISWRWRPRTEDAG
ncbi:hypothetical protein OAK85_04910 [Mariniblastus sp.]|nr:hypothetical protein [Mariniblastus sp.]